MTGIQQVSLCELVVLSGEKHPQSDTKKMKFSLRTVSTCPHCLPMYISLASSAFHLLVCFAWDHYGCSVKRLYFPGSSA